MVNHSLNFQDHLTNFGYESCLNEAPTIFAQSLDTIFFKFEKKTQHLISKYFEKKEPPKKYRFPYYALAEQAIFDIFGKKDGDQILVLIRNEITKRIDFDSQGTIDEILNGIQKRNILSFIRNLSGNEHILYLWSSKKLKNDIMKEFFSPTETQKGYISSEKSNLNNVENITYSQLLSNKKNATQTELQLVITTHEKNQVGFPTRVAGDDCTQWFKADLTSEFLILEKSLDEYFEKNSVSCICGYNGNEIQDKKLLKELLDRHRYVLLDDPYVLFKKVI